MPNLSSLFLAGRLTLAPARLLLPSRPLRAATSASSVSGDQPAAPPAHFVKGIQRPEAVSPTYTHLVSSASPSAIDGVKLKARGFRASPELGLLSLLFVLSMAIGSIICVAIVSLTSLTSFRRLAVSMEELYKVVSEEMPGTLSSLKLSSLEINELTRQLSNIRQKIPGKKERGKKN
ncbi:hypothetical protein SAY86_025168 [Trapa natans]|uniref:Uncharacterized protein n=1 Tax=Trapa natans TaxID=22666 RepID=A0AAN7RKH1_TRANT|nr:hypothetical protein SAY86_025168 [Trapa natans]